MTAYAAGVEGEEYGFLTSKTRQGAIEEALTPLLEDVAAGNKGPGDWTVVVHTDPEWCEGEGCEEHEPEHDRCMVTSADWTDVHIEVLHEDPEDDDCEPEWRYSDPIEQLRQAFPRLKWATKSGRYRRHIGQALGTSWMISVRADLTRAGVYYGGCARDVHALGDDGRDPVAELRTIVEAEGVRLARESDQLAEAARLLGGVPQSDWRAALAEDNASYMARERDDAQDRVAEMECELGYAREALRALLPSATPLT